MKLKIKGGTVSRIARVFIQDATSTSGAGLTGLTFSTSGLKWYYSRVGDSGSTALTPVTATVGTFASAGFVAVDGTNLPGVYEIGLPNAALASGASAVHLMLYGAANMVPVPIEIELDAVDYQNAVTYGLSSLPNATAGANGGLPLANSSGNVAADLQTIKTQAVTAAAPVTVLASLGTATTSTAQSGDSFARLGTPAGASVSADIAAVESHVSPLPSSFPANFSSLGISAGGKISEVAVVNTVTGLVSLDFTQAIPTTNTAQTVGDALNAARAQGFGKWVLSGTSLTLYAGDGTTVVRTFTLDSATAPTMRS